MKQSIMDNVSVFLLRKGFTIRRLTRTCFDIVARRQDQILLVKVLEDANSISKEYTEAMNGIAHYIAASPVIVSEKAGDRLKDNVVYTRFGMPTVNRVTFENCVNNRLPFVRRTKAGLTASLIGDKFREFREKEGYSLPVLASKIGVSSTMMRKYEQDDVEVTLNKALRIYDVMGQDVFSHVDIFSFQGRKGSEAKSSLSVKYTELGFDASDTSKAPFDIIARKEGDIILTEVRDRVNPQLKSLSRMLDADNLVIFKKNRPKGIPALTRKEFLEFEKANDLIKFLKEFRD